MIRSVLRSNGFVVAVDQGVVSGCSFLTTLIAARTLTVESFGQFSLALLGTLFLSNLHRAVFTQPMNVLGPMEPPERLEARVHAQLRAHTLAVPLAAVFLATLAIWFFPSVQLWAAAVFSACALFLQDTLRRYWYTNGEIRSALANDVVSYVGQLLAMVALVMLGALSAASVFLAMGASSLAAFALGVRTLPTRGSASHFSVASMLAEHWPMARWLVLTALAVWGAGQVYPFLVAPLGPEVVATFAACRNLLNAVGPVVQSLGNYVPSRVAALVAAGNTRAVSHHLRKMLAHTAWVAILFLALIQGFAQELLHGVFAGKYDAAAGVLRILSLGTVCSLLGSLLGAYSLALQDSRASFIANLCATGLTFTVGVLLVSSHGVVGAAVGNVISLSFATLVQAALLVRTWPRVAGVRTTDV